MKPQITKGKAEKEKGKKEVTSSNMYNKSLTQQKRKDQLNKHWICDIISFDGISL